MFFRLSLCQLLVIYPFLLAQIKFYRVFSLSSNLSLIILPPIAILDHHQPPNPHFTSLAALSYRAFCLALMNNQFTQLAYWSCFTVCPSFWLEVPYTHRKYLVQLLVASNLDRDSAVKLEQMNNSVCNVLGLILAADHFPALVSH